MEYPKVHASKITSDNRRVEILIRHEDYPGPRYFVRVDNGRDVLSIANYYELPDAAMAFKAELAHRRQITEV